MTDPVDRSTAGGEGSTSDGGEGPASRRELLLRRWRAVPAPLRKTIVLVIGATLLAIGGVLVILPGPFTLPFVVAALALLASEFVWAERVFQRGKDVTARVVGTVRQVPLWIVICFGVLIASGLAATAYWWFTHRN
jgi:hypothetical protein